MLRNLLGEAGHRLAQELVWNLAMRIPLGRRVVQPAPGHPGWVRIGVGGSSFLMPDHGWWRTFAGGWERETERVYRTLVRPGATVVDVGAWIGPTAMFASACRAARILAIEPNPACRRYLDALAAAVMRRGTELLICPIGIHAARGELEFGTPSGEMSATSAASLRGTGVRIEVDRLPEVLAKYAFGNPAFMKIDIEGAEFIIADQIQSFAAVSGTRIFLSLHPGLEPARDRRSALVTALADFDLYDASLKAIAHDVVAERVSSDQPMPDWGTEYGNFFEVLLVPRGEPMVPERASSG